MTARASTLLLAALAIAALMSPLFIQARPVVVWNATPSAARGLYRIVPAGGPQIGDLVLARTPLAYVGQFAERGYLPADVPMLKQVAAVAGSMVCRSSMTVTINGVAVAEALVSDSQGRLLPAWSGCQQLHQGEVFLLAPQVHTSLDGRYFGVVATSTVLGRAVPLWTW
jgi:conjugative transfer signal peptidase TraF